MSQTTWERYAFSGSRQRSSSAGRQSARGLTPRTDPTAAPAPADGANITHSAGVNAKGSWHAWVTLHTATWLRLDGLTGASGPTPSFATKDPWAEIGYDARTAMFRRPEIEVRFSPPKGVAGGVLNAEVVLNATRAMAIDGIELRLSSEEWFPMGNDRLHHDHIAQTVRFPGATLHEGTTTYVAKFALPDSILPSYDGAATGFVAAPRIEHALALRVRIPWWFDQRMRFRVPLDASPRSPGKPPPGGAVYSTHSKRSPGGEVSIEVSMDRCSVERGGELALSVAVFNAKIQGVKELSLDLLSVETTLRRPEVSWGAGTTRIAKTRALHRMNPPPDDGVSIPLRFQVPFTIAPSFEAYYFSHTWGLVVTATSRFGRETRLEIPIHIEASKTPFTLTRPPSDERPPVGRQRHERLLSSITSKTGLAFDEDDLSWRGQVGNVRLTIPLEDLAASSERVANFTYPNLGLALEVSPRAWADVLRLGELLLEDDDFRTEFVARGRFVEQARVVLDPALRRALRSFDSGTMTDESASVSRIEVGVDEPALVCFAKDSLAFAALLDERAKLIPPPPPLAHYEAAFRTFATGTRARFEPGRMALHDLRLGDRVFSVVTQWEDRLPIGTRVCMLLPYPLAKELGGDEASLGPTAKKAIVELRGMVHTLRVGPHTIEASLEGAVETPENLRALLNTMARLPAHLSYDGARGPYR